MNQTPQPKKKLNKRTLLVIGGLLVVVVLLLLTLSRCSEEPNDYGVINPEPKTQERTDSFTEGSYEGMTQEEILADMLARKVKVTTTIATDSLLEDGLLYTIVENPEKNVVTWSITYKLKDTDTVVATASPLDPGQHITELKALAELDPGNYLLDVFIDMYEMDTYSFISTKVFQINMTVK